MKHCKIDFSSIHWDIITKGLRTKSYKQNGKQIRLVEFTDEFSEIDWCQKRHIGYILEGQLEVNFNGNKVVFNKDDGLFIPEGEKYKHMGKPLTKIVKIIFFEDI